MIPLKTKDFGLVTILLIAVSLFFPQRALASQLPQEEQEKVTLNVTSERISDILTMIERQTDYVFAWNGDAQKKFTTRRSISVNDTPVLQVLSSIFKDTGLNFSIKGKQIFISEAPKEEDENATNGSASTISGTVISAVDNQPIIGAVVYVDGQSSNVSMTDIDGNYTINVPAGAKNIVFSCLGYTDRKVPCNQPILLKVVTMSEESNILQDAVVVGFGKQKKESMVGSVTAISPGELKTTSSNLSNAFAGRIAGVVTVQSSGEPGADGSNFWIRGISTFGTNNQPLIILDGVEIDNSVLNMISPESIEQFSVLKDATSTALYGSKGANGVLIVTTKEGRSNEKMMVNIRVENGWTMPSRMTPIADGVTYMENYNEARRNDNLTDYYSEEKILGTRLGINPYVYPNNDWYSMMFKDFSYNQTANVNLRGGGKRINYFLNACINHENGIIKNNDVANFSVEESIMKYQFQSNVTAQVTNTTKVSLKMTTQISDRYKPVTAPNTLFLYTMQSNPVSFPAYFPAEEEDTHVRYGSAPSWGTGDVLTNPLAFLNMGYYTIGLTTQLTTVNIDQDLNFITKGLKASFMASFKSYQDRTTTNHLMPYYYRLADYSVNPDGTYSYTMAQVGGDGNEYLSSKAYYSGNRRFNIQANVDYSRTFRKHDVSGTLVFLMSQLQDGNVLPFRTMGFAGRATYNYDSRYFIEGNFGYNGSENFAKGKRWGFFPSVAGGWVISNEPFYSSDFKKVVSLLKLRASYGLSGNDSLSQRFPYIGSVTIKGNRGVYFGKDEIITYTAGSINTWSNPDATWEVSRKLNVGIELGLFSNLTLIADIFKEHRSGIFMQRRSTPASTGFQSQTAYANIGEVDNQGIDASLEYKKVFNKDFTISAQGTFTYAHNEVVAKDEPAYQYEYQKLVGKPINAIYGYVAAGLFQSQEEIDNWPRQDFGEILQPGDIKYVDLNSDGVIDGDDQTSIGFPTIPEINYGFGISINYKKFDFSFLFQGAANVSILMSNHHPFMTKDVTGLNMTKWVADDHWTKDNPNAAYPRLSSVWNNNNTAQSSFWVKNGAYIRLKNVEFGYSFYKFRAFATASNLFTLSPFKYWDPEMGSGNGLSYPIQTVVRLGLQYNFQ